jgi:predicted nucleotidyltransferase
MKNLTIAIESIARQFRLADIYVFGSRSGEVAARLRAKDSAIDETPALHTGSDIDIGILPHTGVIFTAQDRVNLAIALEDLLDAPRVDIVLLPEAEPFLALDIIRGELMYTDDPDRQSEYELYVLRRAGDLLPFKLQRMKSILEEGSL